MPSPVVKKILVKQLADALNGGKVIDIFDWQTSSNYLTENLLYS